MRFFFKLVLMHITIHKIFCPIFSEDGLPRKRKARLGDITRSAAKNGRFVMGNPLLSKLWNQWPDNLEACSAPERDFLPSMEEYFGEAIGKKKTCLRKIRPVFL